MSELTPETLEAQLRGLQYSCDQPGHNLYDVVRAHVPAWKADLARIEVLEKLRPFVQHLPGCMEPGFTDDDCVCGLRAILRGEEERWLNRVIRSAPAAGACSPSSSRS